MEELAVSIQNSVSLMRSGAGIFTGMMLAAQAAGAFVEALLCALDKEDDVYKFAFVASAVSELPFFASRVKLGLNGIEEVIMELHGLRKYEKKAGETLKCKLKLDIEKRINSLCCTRVSKPLKVSILRRPIIPRLKLSIKTRREFAYLDRAMDAGKGVASPARELAKSRELCEKLRVLVKVHSWFCVEE